MTGLKDVEPAKIGYICACIAICVVVVTMGSCCKRMNDASAEYNIKALESRNEVTL